MRWPRRLRPRAPRCCGRSRINSTATAPAVSKTRSDTCGTSPRTRRTSPKKRCRSARRPREANHEQAGRLPHHHPVPDDPQRNRIMSKPEGYHTITPYLMIRSATESMRDSDAEGKVRHAEIGIGDSQVMITDALVKQALAAPAA